MLKLLLASLVTLLSVTSAFVTPSSSTSISSRSVTPAAVAAVKVPTSLFVSTTSSNDLPTTHLAVAATASVMTTLLAPLAVFAEEAGDYEYGAVAAPGGIGLAVGLGVLAVSSLYNSLFFMGGGGACCSCFESVSYVSFLLVLKILTAAVPVILAPGEDAFNEMKAKDGDFSKNAKLKSSGKGKK